ncbi:hypothetical protein AB3F22_13945 [Actinomyces johnsonii]|uniref:hypothetical protein n=1 Tax=Actinomyces johnsonii TaxID=544581 RepID=UPI0012E25B52|nr:hypothetical protein [Actinomyces johnsonii]
MLAAPSGLEAASRLLVPAGPSSSRRGLVEGLDELLDGVGRGSPEDDGAPLRAAPPLLMVAPEPGTRGRLAVVDRLLIRPDGWGDCSGGLSACESCEGCRPPLRPFPLRPERTGRARRIPERRGGMLAGAP